MSTDQIPRPHLLRDASDTLTEVLEALATAQTLASGDTLFYQGDTADALYRIDSGLIEISVVSPDGRRAAVNVLGADEIVGEIALFSDGPRTATATALEPCKVSRFARRALFDQIEETPELALEMIRLAGIRMRWLSQQFEDQAFLPAELRLARKILFLLDRLPHKNDTIEVSQAALADHVGVTRELVSKSLSVWKRRGWVALGRSKLTVLDRNALIEAAEFDAE